MKASVLREFGGPEKLALEEVPDPKPGPTDVVIQVKAVSVNSGLDFAARSGKYARPVRLPHVLGVDPSGVVVEVGSQVTDRSVGDRVWADFFIGCGDCAACNTGDKRACKKNRMLGIDLWGGYAERVVVPARNTTVIPDGLGFPDATVIARHFPIAMYLLDDRASLAPGEWVLVMGATGGLGNAAVQVAKQMGATVIAGAGSDSRVAAALKAGAHFGVNYRTKDLAEEVNRITGGAGVDVVCENIADPTLWPGAFGSLAMRGRLVTAGAHGGGRVELDVSRLYLRRISILGGADVPANGVERAFHMALQGAVNPGIDRVVPLADAATAHRLIEDGETIGKIVLAP